VSLSLGQLGQGVATTKSAGSQSLMKTTTITLTCNTILEAKFYRAGEPIPKDIVPPQLRRYAVKEVNEPTESKEINVMYEHNRLYSVDEDGFLRPPVGRQMAELQAEAEETDAIVDEIAEAELDETTAAALEQAQEDHQADVQRQIGNARYAAEHAEQAEDAVRAEQDATVENGEFDVMDSPPKELKPKRPVPSAKAFVKRYGRFVLAASVDLIPGEKLYRHRKRSLGVSEKYIAFSKVKEE
jgi:hypothetical protein